jgi:transposase-like protein
MRWTFKRKAEIVAALRAGTVTAKELKLQHGISPEELATWVSAYDKHGVDGLRVTKLVPAVEREKSEQAEWRAAKFLIRRYGERAHVEADRLASLRASSEAWQSRWARIGRVIEVLQADHATAQS